jgi:hypothetical protein
VAALAALLAAGPAAAYVRTRDPGTGTELRWPLPTVAWRLNRDWPSASPTCAATGAGDPTLDAIRTSFGAWEQSCADIRLVYGGTSDEIRIGLGGTSENVVVFRKGWCSQNADAIADPCFTSGDLDCGGIYDCFEDACAPGATTCADWGIVALTSVLYDPGTGRIMDADIEVNGWDGVDSGSVFGSPPRHGWYFTCADPAVVTTQCSSYGEDGCAFIDLQNTVTHEVGHFVGLAHTPKHAPGAPEDSWSTMEPTTAAGETWKRSLSPDDVAGVCAIYPPPSGGGLGCGSGGAAGAISLLLAALALRRLS